MKKEKKEYVYKIHKKELIQALLFAFMVFGFIVASIFVDELKRMYLLGLVNGMAFPFVLGFTKMNREHDSVFEKIEIKKKEVEIVQYYIMAKDNLDFKMAIKNHPKLNEYNSTYIYSYSKVVGLNNVILYKTDLASFNKLYSFHFYQYCESHNIEIKELRYL